MRKGDFTPGASLAPEQIERVMLFLAYKGKTNDETLANLTAFFSAPPKKEPNEQQ